MGKKVINPINDIELEDIKQLSDRSDLTRLYFKPTDNCYAGAVPARKKQMTKADFKKLVKKTANTVGFLMTVPFIAGEILMLFIATVSSGNLSLVILLPISLSSLLFIYLVSYAYSRAIDKLGEIGVSTNFIIIYTSFCLALIAWPAYRFTQIYPSLVTQQLLFCTAISAVSIMTCRSLLGLVDNDTSSYPLKIATLVTPPIICAGLAMLSVVVSFI